MEEEDSEDKSDFISTEDSRHILGNGSDEEDERSEDGYEDSEVFGVLKSVTFLNPERHVFAL